MFENITLSTQELQIVQNIVAGVHNTTTYGYDVLVRGTMLDGIVTLTFGVMSLIVALVCAKMLSHGLMEGGESLNDKAWTYAIAFVMAAFAGLCTMGILEILFGNAIMSTCAPEYIVITKILSGCISVAT